MSFNVFLSYSRRDDALATLVFDRISGLDKTHVLVDRKLLRGSEPEVHETLRKAIHDADLVVALLTPEGKNSWEVRQELVIARECWKPIIVVLPDKQVGEVHTRRPEKHVAGLPYFLQDPNWVAQEADTLEKAGATEDLLNQLEMRIEQVRREHPQFETERKIHQAARKISETASTWGAIRGPSAQYELQNILSVTQAACEDAVEQNREVNLALDANYVIRAGSYFSTAHLITAVSRDDSSRFWRSDQRHAIDYLKRQKGICARLFVFSNPHSADRHRFVMAAHHDHYGTEAIREDKGGVFYCSAADYQNHILPELLGLGHEEAQGHPLSRGDFGILCYVDGARTNYLQLTLSPGGHFRKRPLHDVPSPPAGSILSFFEFLRTQLKPGTWQESRKLWRWNNSFARSDEQWRSSLSQIFLGDNSGTGLVHGEVVHAVLFKSSVDRNKLVRALHQEAARLEGMQHLTEGGLEPVIEELTFLVNTEELKSMRVRDGQFGGTLSIDSELVRTYPYALLSRHPSPAHLENYYNARVHSQAREAILRTIDPDLAGKLYDMLYQLPDKAPQRETLYRAIDSRCNDLFFRADFQVLYDLSAIVAEPSRDDLWYREWFTKNHS
jgi:hypothetical protein